MTKQMIATLILVFCAISTVNALSVNSYKSEKNDEMRKLNKAYLSGVRDGIVTVNHAVELDGKRPFFCLPIDGLRFEQAEDTMVQRSDTSRTIEYMPVWAVLFEALKDKFPCVGPK
jgi:Rap1a immunity proteins